MFYFDAQGYNFEEHLEELTLIKHLFQTSHELLKRTEEKTFSNM